MKFSITDPKVFEILTRNRLTYWPDLNCTGTDLTIANGDRTVLPDGSILKNHGYELILIKEGTPPVPGLVKLKRSVLCETGWGSVIENDHCGKLTQWQYDGWNICTDCMRRKVTLYPAYAEVFKEAIEQSVHETALTRFFLALGVYVVMYRWNELHIQTTQENTLFLSLLEEAIYWEQRYAS